MAARRNAWALRLYREPRLPAGTSTTELLYVQVDPDNAKPALAPATSRAIDERIFPEFNPIIRNSRYLLACVAKQPCLAG